MPPAVEADSHGSRGALPTRARLLALGTEFDAAARAVLTDLLASQIPPRPQDSADIAVLQAHLGHADLGWLPDAIPVRVTRAQVLGTMLADPTATDRALHLLPQHLDTATDVLRTLAVADGGPADLSEVPARRRSLPRRVRRAILALLETFPFPYLAEDLRRHPGDWKHAAEGLHPFEDHKRYPKTALAFAILRQTRVDGDSALTEQLLATASSYPESVQLDDGSRLRLRTWTSRVERALAAGDLEAAVVTLAERPGELLRRLNHVATRVADADPALLDVLVKALTSAVPKASPGVLLSALGALRGRADDAGTNHSTKRVYFPATGPYRMWIVPDKRAPLPAATVAMLCAVLTDELDRRAALLPATEQVVLDAGLADLIAPFLQKSVSESLVDLPRGSVRQLPDGKTIRLFLHWMDPANVDVDLDLSLAFFDRDWKTVDWCDYTHLRARQDSAIHSGDLTSAPPPLGASEFVDMDRRALLDLGVAYAAAVVFSYSGHAFEDLEEAFAGVMLRDRDATGHFDARAVEQRFDLHGAARAAMPMTIDLAAGTMRWLDFSGAAGGAGANVQNQQMQLAWQACALEELFASGRRVSLWEVACRQAAGTSDHVVVRTRDGELRSYRRRTDDGETRSEFAARLLALGSDEGAGTLPTGTPARFLMVDADFAIPAGSEVYALYPGMLDACEVHLLDAASLVSALAPTA